MEYTNFVEQDYCDAASFALAYLGAELAEKSLDVAPLHVPADRVSKNNIERPLVLPLHVHMVP